MRHLFDQNVFFDAVGNFNSHQPATDLVCLVREHPARGRTLIWLLAKRVYQRI
jgi:hypothetical protein